MSSLYDGLPEILFKYRDWDDNYHRRLLTRNELYFASTLQFNDPFDSALPFRFDESELSKENIFLKIRELVMQENPDLSEAEIEEKAFEHQQAERIKDPDHIKKVGEDTVADIGRIYGVVSLSETSDDILMWSHYSNSHSGFCIGFNSKRLFELAKGKLMAISYKDQYPHLSIFDHPLERMRKLTTVKSAYWSYEKEYRLSKTHYARQTLKIPSELIVEIILGCKMSQETKFELLKIAEKRFPEARVFEMQKDSEYFKLNKNRIR